MSIKPSAASEVRALVASLDAADDIKREAAIARLAVIGARAVDRLLAAYSGIDTNRATKVAILRVLEAIGDPRAIPVAKQALLDGGDVAVAGAGALRALLDSPVAGAAAASLDALVAAALDRGAERRVRRAAFDALQEMPQDVRERVAHALEDDPDSAIAAHLTDAPREAATADAVWQDALERRLADDPVALREASVTRAQSAALGSLQKLVDAVRAREGASHDTPRAHEWRALRGALHQALALRGSRVALYDLRETLDGATEALPATFVAALHVVGDESCLQPIASAYARATDARWRHQLEAAFKAIVKREKLARRPAARLLSTPSRTTPRRKPRGRT